MALKNYAYYTNEQDLKIHISAILSNITPSGSANAQFIHGEESYPADRYITNTNGSYTLELTLDGKSMVGGKIYTYTPTIYGQNNGEIAIVPSFEFARLISIDRNGNERMLPLKYNVDISGLKPNVADVITPTLGGKYPFIRRNGAQDYDSFSLNGLVCLEAERDDYGNLPSPYSVMDTYNKQLNLQDNVAHSPMNGIKKQSSFISMFLTEDELRDLNTYAAQVNKGISEYDYKIIIERYYREKILNFLKEPTVKLFKSMTEGDKFVYLSNISLTPDKVSGRALYSFSCQATEVGGNYDMVVKKNGTED